ncbi:hypothetical protein MTBLM5_110002 [Magnetospirillum sp. LM-5]|uniref:hypothetical protein n=1 Tax=Magnetospirillum sp. LM-5 TaxID=2681466 RepID=UPI00138298E4|nr:hypothetical protein [Magnetospirillum sp. LM-5]CAA7613248.1 hypothetical protein MTBLM5_110002 [Magnetospirillum sp. LM-5]
MRQELQEIKVHIYEDGSISESELRLLRGLFAGGFGEEEAALLLDLNNVLSDEDLPAAFADLFVEMLAGYVVVDSAVDAARWEWMRSTMLNDNQIDAIELRLLGEIAGRAKAVPESLAQYLK